MKRDFYIAAGVINRAVFAYGNWDINLNKTIFVVTGGGSRVYS